MKKETTIAIFFGIFFGAIVAVFLIVRNKNSKFNTKTLSPATSVTPSVKNVTSGKILEVTSPEDGSINSTNSVSIKGKTEKGALLVIQSPIKDLIVVAEKEDFSIPFPLALGENNIVITSYEKGTQVKTQVKDLRVYYLTN